MWFREYSIFYGSIAQSYTCLPRNNYSPLSKNKGIQRKHIGFLRQYSVVLILDLNQKQKKKRLGEYFWDVFIKIVKTLMMEVISKTLSSSKESVGTCFNGKYLGISKVCTNYLTYKFILYKT